MIEAITHTATANPALSQIALLVAAAVAIRLKAAPSKNWQSLAIGAALVAVLAALMRS